MEVIRISAVSKEASYPSLGGKLYLTEDSRNEMVILMGGFARVATEERLLLAIAENLKKSAFILDWHGLGMSEGDFGDVTVSRLFQDLTRTIGYFKSKGYARFHLIGHSLGACVIALAQKELEGEIGRQVLLSPALNQAYLLRYWFARKDRLRIRYNEWAAYNDQAFREKMIKLGFKKMLNRCWPYEEQFNKSFAAGQRLKGMIIKPDYWQAEKDVDYGTYFQPDSQKMIQNNQVLHLHGKSDSSVPLSCVGLKFAKRHYLSDAGHYFTGYEKFVIDDVSRFIS